MTNQQLLIEAEALRPDLLVYLTNRLRGDQELAQQVTQATLASASRCIDKFDRTKCFKSWLHANADHRGKWARKKPGISAGV